MGPVLLIVVPVSDVVFTMSPRNGVGVVIHDIATPGYVDIIANLDSGGTCDHRASNERVSPDDYGGSITLGDEIAFHHASLANFQGASLVKPHSPEVHLGCRVDSYMRVSQQVAFCLPLKDSDDELAHRVGLETDSIEVRGLWFCGMNRLAGIGGCFSGATDLAPLREDFFQMIAVTTVMRRPPGALTAGSTTGLIDLTMCATLLLKKPLFWQKSEQSRWL